MRFRKPTLGVWSDGRIGPFAPGCQVFFDVFDEDGRQRTENSHLSLTMASFDPHTTRLTVPDCVACHLDPKVLGLGEGSLKVTGRGLQSSLDAFVSANGKPLQSASRDGARPFNEEELGRITRVSLCLPCHDSYKDPIYLGYDRSLRRVQCGETPCRIGVAF